MSTVTVEVLDLLSRGRINTGQAVRLIRAIRKATAIDIRRKILPGPRRANPVLSGAFAAFGDLPFNGESIVLR